ncbi:MAG: hypothetical protein JWL81_3106, partial [Verrucomicrobiales bacterium]|nr:hypothetical protein [Verrucomicrobiales bacterium]
KRGIPVAPVQLENLALPGYLDSFRLIVMSYHGQKPLSAAPHPALAEWVKRGGTLVFADDDTDPCLTVREWWNTPPMAYPTPRLQLFETFGWTPTQTSAPSENQAIGKGFVTLLRENPASFASSPAQHDHYLAALRTAAAQAQIPWQETNHLILRRGPYLIAAGLTESIEAAPTVLTGRFIDLFDPALKLQTRIEVQPASRLFLLDLDRFPQSAGTQPTLIASACRALPVPASPLPAWTIEGVGDTDGILLLHSPAAPSRVALDAVPITSWTYDPAQKLLHINFPNTSHPRTLVVSP